MSPLSYSPAQFHEMISPVWARVYIEVFDSLKTAVAPGDLAWRDQRVVASFCRLCGMSEHALQFAPFQPLAEQLTLIAQARVVGEGLYLADELAQLDGQPALDYALGYAAADRWLHARPPSACVDCDTVRCRGGLIEAGEQLLETLHPVVADAFRAGVSQYVTRLQSGCTAGVGGTEVAA